MAPLTSYLTFALAGLFASTLAAPAPLPIASTGTLSARNTANFTVYAAAPNDPAVNNLVFALYPFADGYYQGYLYDHKSIPISIANDFNLQFNAASANLVTSLNPALQVVLEEGGNVSAGPQGTQGFWIVPETEDLAFDFGSQGLTQDGFVACPWTGDQGTGILYTVGWVNQGAAVPEGCEAIKLHTTL